MPEAERLTSAMKLASLVFALVNYHLRRIHRHAGNALVSIPAGEDSFDLGISS